MRRSPLEPLVYSIEVRCSQSRAFDTWVSRPVTWWPLKDHSTFGAEAAAVVIEPGVGGRIYERNHNGAERDWGRITGWDPPASLGFTWHIYGGPHEATDVEVSFDQIDSARTRVIVTHSGWERLTERAAELRNGNRAGWTALLNAFSRAING